MNQYIIKLRTKDEFILSCFKSEVRGIYRTSTTATIEHAKRFDTPHKANKYVIKYGLNNVFEEGVIVRPYEGEKR